MICPGHRAVHEFGDSELYEDEGETEYVILDLGSQIEPTLLHGTKSYRLIGLDTPTPMLQLRGSILAGSIEPLIGSELLFTEPDLVPQPDDIDDGFVTPRAPLLESFSTPSHHILFREVELRPRSAHAANKPANPEAEPLSGSEKELPQKPRETRLDNCDIERMAGNRPEVNSATAMDPPDSMAQYSSPDNHMDVEENS